MQAVARRVSLIMVIALAASTAYADERPVPVAIGVNSPFSWSSGFSFGASLYVALDDHHALRGNFARYTNHSTAIGDIAAGLAGDDGDEASRTGRITDLGVSWVYYPRHRWSGPTLELGVLRRAYTVGVEDDLASPEVVNTRTTTYGARAMAGWSWLFYDRVFLAIAVGLSAGHESGTETSQRTDRDMPMRASVSRADINGEGLLRLGVAFDL